jgi:putative transcriptional regulator
MPDHGHKGTEMTMVLKGAFHDEDDYFARGDVDMADEDLHHTPVADIHEDCICLAVSDAPLEFKGLIPKLLQPLLRI